VRGGGLVSSPAAPSSVGTPPATADQCESIELDMGHGFTGPPCPTVCSVAGGSTPPPENRGVPTPGKGPSAQLMSSPQRPGLFIGYFTRLLVLENMKYRNRISARIPARISDFKRTCNPKEYFQPSVPWISTEVFSSTPGKGGGTEYCCFGRRVDRLIFGCQMGKLLAASLPMNADPFSWPPGGVASRHRRPAGGGGRR